MQNIKNSSRSDINGDIKNQIFDHDISYITDIHVALFDIYLCF